MKTLDPTHKAVQEHYGKYAKETGSCCGASTSCEASQNSLYPAALLDGIPVDIASFSAGSGDPISLARLVAGEIVLDLGSGGGLDCFLAARQVGAGGQVIGVEMTSEMLSRARSNAERLKFQNVEFREGLLEELPVVDGSIDVIISNCVINLSPDKPRVFREMKRVLKTGGRIAVSDIVTNHPISEADQQDRENWCNCTTGALSARAYAEELGEAGFIDIRIEPNEDVILKAIERRQVPSQQERSQSQILKDLSDWENIDRMLIIPAKITARKPG